MKVLLIYTNRNRNLGPPPVGIAYLLPPLKRAGYPVRVLDLMFSKSPMRDLRQTLGDFRPDVVGFSIRNLDEQDMFNPASALPEIKEYVDLVRTAGLPTVLGGSGFSTIPREMLAYLEADYGIAGQGEKSLPLLIRGLDEGRVDREIPGLVWREDGSIRANPLVKDGYRGTTSDWSDIHLRNDPRYPFPACVVTKSGCPYNCVYCDAKWLVGSAFVLREIDEIVDEIRTIARVTGVRSFQLADPVFNCPSDWAKSVLEAIIRARLGVLFTTTVVPVPGTYDDELFELFWRAGGRFFVVGGETLSEPMLDRYRKPFALADVIECVRLARQHKITVGLDLMLGGPGESAATIEESATNLSKVDYALLLYGFGIRIAPEAELFDIAKEEGFIDHKHNLLFPRFYLSKELDLSWARAHMRRAAMTYGYRQTRMVPFGMRMMLGRFLGVTV